jgi:hypothetical protein
MKSETVAKNYKRLFIGIAPEITLTTDPRRWARAFRCDGQPIKTRSNPARASRKAVCCVRRAQANLT